jgi:hypothetical protein
MRPIPSHHRKKSAGITSELLAEFEPANSVFKPIFRSNYGGLIHLRIKADLLTLFGVFPFLSLLSLLWDYRCKLILAVPTHFASYLHISNFLDVSWLLVLYSPFQISCLFGILFCKVGRRNSLWNSMHGVSVLLISFYLTTQVFISGAWTCLRCDFM